VTSVLFTSHPQDGLVVNLYIPHNRRTPLQAEEALGPISIPRGSRGVHFIEYLVQVLWFEKNQCQKEALTILSLKSDFKAYFILPIQH
jgi:hypothetical protein